MDNNNNNRNHNTCSHLCISIFISVKQKSSFAKKCHLKGGDFLFLLQQVLFKKQLCKKKIKTN